MDTVIKAPKMYYYYYEVKRNTLIIAIIIVSGIISFNQYSKPTISL